MAALPAQADTIGIAGSSVTLQATDRPGALAEIVMVNDPSNGPADNGTRKLSLGDLSVSVEFQWNMAGDDDAITVTPPDGVSCLPTSCVLLLPEGETETLWLFDATGAGS